MRSADVFAIEHKRSAIGEQGEGTPQYDLRKINRLGALKAGRPQSASKRNSSRAHRRDWGAVWLRPLFAEQAVKVSAKCGSLPS